MLILLSLFACGLFGPSEPQVDPAVCAADSTQLAEDLARTAAILSCRVPAIEKVGEHISAPSIAVPLGHTGATSPIIVMQSDNSVKVGPKTAVSLDDADLVATLRGVVGQVAAPADLPAAPAELSPLPREAWTSWYAARSKPALTLAIDGGASGVAAARLLQALHEAGAHEVGLVVKLSKAPTMDMGVAPGTPGEGVTSVDHFTQIWGDCDTSWSEAVEGAPPAMRPWVFADRAPAAYAACACKPEAEQIKWQLAGQFEAPAHATVRLVLGPKGKKVVASPGFVATARDLVEASVGGGAVWLEASDAPAVPRIDKTLPGKASKRPLANPAFGPRKGR